MDERTNTPHEQIGRGSHPKIDAIYTAKYDDLVRGILEQQAKDAQGTNPLDTILQPDQESDYELAQQNLEKFAGQFSAEQLENNPQLGLFIDSLEVVLDEMGGGYVIQSVEGYVHLYLNYMVLTEVYLPKNLIIAEIDLSNNYFTTIPDLPSAVGKVDFKQNPIRSIDVSQLPPHIKILFLSHCEELKEIKGDLPEGLEHLSIAGTPIDSISSIPASLKILNISATKINSLLDLGNLEEFQCEAIANKIRLGKLPEKLEKLSVSHSKEIIFDGPLELPRSLKDFSCVNCGWTELPSLPPKLSILHCSGNLLTQLPALPDSLKTILCSNNNLTSLPPLPPLLDKLYCGNNKYLTSLPTLPQRLRMLDCDACALTMVPDLPPSLNDVHCKNNELTELPNFASDHTRITASGNPLSEKGIKQLQERAKLMSITP